MNIELTEREVEVLRQLLSYTDVKDYMDQTDPDAYFVLEGIHEKLLA